MEMSSGSIGFYFFVLHSLANRIMPSTALAVASLKPVSSKFVIENTNDLVQGTSKVCNE